MLTDALTLAWREAALAALALLTLGAVAGRLTLRRGGRSNPAPGSVQAGQPSEGSVSQKDGAGGHEAEALTAGLIGAYDLATGSPAVRSHIQQVLRGAGVVAVSAEPGAPFDPAAHLAVDTEPANFAEAGAAGQVARQVRPGWASGDVLLRPAEVIVWTK